MEETGDAADTTADTTTQKNPEEIAMSWMKVLRMSIKYRIFGISSGFEYII